MAKHDDYSPFRRSRSQQYARRRRKNMILNILIAIVFVAIIIVGYNLLFSNDSETNQAEQPQDETPIEQPGEDESSEEQTVENEQNESDESVIPENREETETENQEEEPADEETTENEEENNNEDVIISEENEDPNVVMSIIDPNWKPIGTSQTGDHVTNYEEGSADRTEMEEAISYAVEIPRENLIFWRLERGEVPNKHVNGTVTEKTDKTRIFKVYLEWVDGQGWKPLKVEQIRESEYVY